MKSHGYTTIDRDLKPFELPAPSIYDPSRADQIWQVDYAELVRAASKFRAEHSVRSRRNDKFVVNSVAIDTQITFGLSSGELSIAPASIPEINRGAEFDYRNARIISEKKKTFDTHDATSDFLAADATR